jgi:hypothetical protein
MMLLEGIGGAMRYLLVLLVLGPLSGCLALEDFGFFDEAPMCSGPAPSGPAPTAEPPLLSRSAPAQTGEPPR